MATHDYVIDNSTGANVRSDINNVLQAILTNNSSSSAPSTTAAYMWWADTTTGILKIRNSANDGWVELLQLDGTLTLEDGSASTPALAFRDDLNTGIFSSAANHVNFATNGVERIDIGTDDIVVNNGGADLDFRIEGDTDANLFKLDAGNNRIGLGIASPTSKLYVNTVSTEHVITAAIADSNGNSIINILAAGTTGNSRILFSDTAANDGIISYSHNDRALVFGTAGTNEDMRLDSSGRLLIGHTSSQTVDSADCALQVLGYNFSTSGFTQQRFVAGVSGPSFLFAKSRGGSVGTQTIVQNGDELGKIRFYGSDGNDFNNYGAEINGSVDGSPSSDSMPGRLVFKTTSSGASATERMRIDKSGNVLVGTTSAIGKFTVKAANSSGSPAYGITNSGKASEGIDLNCTTVGDGNFGGAISFGSGGNGRSGIAAVQTGSDDDRNGLVFLVHSSTAGSDNAHECARFMADGFLKAKGNAASYQNVGVGYHELVGDTAHDVVAKIQHKSSTGYGLQILMNHANSSIYALAVRDYSSGNNDKAFIRADGDLENANNSYGSISDVKLKENIVDAQSQWDDIKALKVRNFNFKSDSSKTKMLGLVAQEAETVCPSLVKSHPDLGENNEDLGTETKVLKYSILYMKAVKALQEAQTRIETLETKVAALESA